MKWFFKKPKVKKKSFKRSFIYISDWQYNQKWVEMSELMLSSAAEISNFPTFEENFIQNEPKHRNLIWSYKKIISSYRDLKG